VARKGKNVREGGGNGCGKVDCEGRLGNLLKELNVTGKGPHLGHLHEKVNQSKTRVISLSGGDLCRI